MLRNWNGDSLTSIREIVKLFGIEANDLRLLKYETLSPDSFIWVVGMNGSRYCLYAEDFVTSTEDVVEAMNEHGTLEGETDDYELLSVKNPKDFESSSPVTSADAYEKPADTRKFMENAVPSGYDFVFLGKSTIS